MNKKNNSSKTHIRIIVSKNKSLASTTLQGLRSKGFRKLLTAGSLDQALIIAKRYKAKMIVIENINVENIAKRISSYNFKKYRLNSIHILDIDN